MNLFIERQLVNGTHPIFRQTLSQWITEQQQLLREISLEKEREKNQQTKAGRDSKKTKSVMFVDEDSYRGLFSDEWNKSGKKTRASTANQNRGEDEN